MMVDRPFRRARDATVWGSAPGWDANLVMNRCRKECGEILERRPRRKAALRTWTHTRCLVRGFPDLVVKSGSPELLAPRVMLSQSRSSLASREGSGTVSTWWASRFLPPLTRTKDGARPRPRTMSSRASAATSEARNPHPAMSSTTRESR